jgi:hypothetical protein
MRQTRRAEPRSSSSSRRRMAVVCRLYSASFSLAGCRKEFDSLAATKSWCRVLFFVRAVVVLEPYHNFHRAADATGVVQPVRCGSAVQ